MSSSTSGPETSVVATCRPCRPVRSHCCQVSFTSHRLVYPHVHVLFWDFSVLHRCIASAWHNPSSSMNTTGHSKKWLHETLPIFQLSSRILKRNWIYYISADLPFSLWICCEIEHLFKNAIKWHIFPMNFIGPWLVCTFVHSNICCFGISVHHTGAKANIWQNDVTTSQFCRINKCLYIQATEEHYYCLTCYRALLDTLLESMDASIAALQPLATAMAEFSQSERSRDEVPSSSQTARILNLFAFLMNQPQAAVKSALLYLPQTGWDSSALLQISLR